VDEGQAVLYPGFLHPEHKALNKASTYWLEMSVSVADSGPELHRDAAEEFSSSPSHRAGVTEGWAEEQMQQLQYSLAKSLFEQVKHPNGTLSDLSTYVDCKRLLLYLVSDVHERHS